MISFQFLVVFCFCILAGARSVLLVRARQAPAGLDAALLFWALLMLFFLPAVRGGQFMVPGDILNLFDPWKTLSGGKGPHNPLLSDITGCAYPWMSLIRESLISGEFPLWNPFSSIGTPLAGNQVSAAFHPFNLFYFVMPLPDAATLFPFLRLFIAGMGGVALLRFWGISKMPAFLGGTLFAFCGVHISWLSNYPEVSVTMLIPWILLSMDKIVFTADIRWWGGLILLSVVQFLGGHCESSFHVYAWAIPWFFARLAQERSRGRLAPKAVWERAGMLVSAGVLSLGLSAFQLFPFLEYLPLTTRMQAIAVSQGNLFLGLDFMEVAKTVTATLISPDFFGNPVTGNYWGSFNYIEQNSHITVTGLVLALAAATCKTADPERNYIRQLLLWGGLAAFLVAIRTPGLFEMIVTLPGFKQNSNHRLIIIFSFAFSMLAAFGVHDIQQGRMKNGKRVVPVTAGILAAAGFLCVYGGDGLTPGQIQYRLYSLGRFFVFLAAAALLFGFGSARATAKKFIPLLALILAVTEIFAWGYRFNTFVPKNRIFPTTPLTDFIRSRQGEGRVAAASGTLPVGTEMMYGFDSVTGLDPMKSHAYEQIFARITGQYSSIYPGRIRSFASPWLNFLNVRYIAAPPGTQKGTLKNPDLNLIYDGQDGRVFENPHAFERIFRVETVVPADTPGQALDLTIQNENRLNHRAVVENFLPPAVGNADPAIVQKNETGVSCPAILVRKNRYLRMDFSGMPQGFYVMSQPYYPGWKLKVDGTPGRIFRTNTAFTGFRIPDGAKRVEIYYDPLSFKMGLLVSGVCLILCLGWAGIRKQLDNWPAQ